MAQGRVVLHVGAMKSGTTFLQGCLFDNKAALEQRGVLLPGKEWRSQARAVHGLLHDRGVQWRKMAERMSSHPGLSVVSMEFLAAATPAKARALRETLSDVDLRVVVTARDLNRSIPAMWQESVQNGRSWSWRDYHDALVSHRPSLVPPGQRPEPAAHFWRQQDLVAIATTWAGVVGPERVDVVTVPAPGGPRDLLWQRFASVLGLDPDAIETVKPANESLGAASAQVMRRLNELLDETGLTFSESQVARKRLLAKSVLASRKGEEPAIGLDVAAWVPEETARTVSALGELGVGLVGEWSDLDPVAVPGIDPDDVDQGLVLETALRGLAGFMHAVVRDPGLLSG